MAEKWLTVKEAASLWRVSPWTIRAWVKAGRVDGQKFSPRCIRILVVTDDESDVHDGVNTGAGVNRGAA